MEDNDRDKKAASQATGSARRGFGVGCFHFSYNDPPDLGSFQPERYVADLRTGLEAIPTLDNLRIDHPAELMLHWRGVNPNSSERLRDGRFFFPHIVFLEVTFDLHIPRRFQEQLVHRKVALSTDEFRLHMRYGRDFTVSYVVPTETTDVDKPADAVVLVREFILAEMAKQVDPKLLFECLGPSPFHADFFAIATPAPADGKGAATLSEEGTEHWLQCITETRRGYDRMSLLYDQGQFASADDALAAVFGEIEDELATFYSLEQQGNRLLIRAAELEGKVRSLIQLQRQGGMRGLVERQFGSSALARDVFIGMAELTAEGNDFEDRGRSDLTRLYGPRKVRCLEPQLEKQLQQNVVRRATRWTDLVGLLEARRVKRLELTSVVVSAILGGLVGAVLTSLLTSPAS